MAAVIGWRPFCRCSATPAWTLTSPRTAPPRRKAGEHDLRLPPMNRHLPRLAVLALPAALFVSLSATYFLMPSFAASAADKADAAAQRPALTVTVDVPRRDSLPLRLSANGDIAAWQEASIGAGVADLRLTEVRVNVGDVVKAGQVLAVFDEETVRIDLAQAQAAVAEAEAAVAEAAANAQRARELQESGALSRQLITQYLTAERTAQARLASARAAADAQALRLKRTRVLAPDDGVISARSATVGAVNAMGTELFRMVRRGRLEWRAALTSAELGKVAAGTGVTLTLPSGEQVAGAVRMVAPTVDTQSRSGLVYVDIPRPGGARAGMFARGEFQLGASEGMTLPQQAVVVREAFSYVFRVGDDGRVSQLKVRTGRRVGERVEVLEGLPAEARVAVVGAGFLNDGDLVRVVEAPAPAAVPAAR